MAADAKAPEPQTQPIVNVTIAQPNLAAEGARAMAEGKALQMDKADVAGGRYLFNGVEVNANGEAVGSSLDKSRV